MRIGSILLILSCLLWNCSSPVQEAKVISGVEIYKNRCVTCHGTDGKMGMNGAKDLPSSSLTAAQRMEVVKHGRNIMPSFGELMTEEEIKAVVDFTMTLQ